MLIFSEIHDWQGNPNVKQILVFPSRCVKEDFDLMFNQRVSLDGIKEAEDNCIGAVYKLRAVKNADGLFSPIIRCGTTGELLMDDINSSADYRSAINKAKTMLYHSLMLSFNPSA